MLNHASPALFSCFSEFIGRGVADRDLGGGVVGAFVEKWFSTGADDALVFQGGAYEGEISSDVTFSSSRNDNDGITGCEELSYGDVIRKDGGGVGDMYSDAK